VGEVGKVGETVVVIKRRFFNGWCVSMTIVEVKTEHVPVFLEYGFEVADLTCPRLRNYLNHHPDVSNKVLVS